MKKLLVISAAFLLLAAPLVSFGAEFKGAEEYKLLRGQAVEGSLYAGGGTVTVEGNVNGDLIVGGGDVFISGTVRDDVLGGGGDVEVSGTVNGDLRVGGGNVTITGNVKGEVVVLGGNVRIASSAKLEQDVVVLGGNVAIDGEVLGHLKIKGGMVTVNGTMRNGADIKAGDKLVLGATAVIEGNLDYSAPREAEIAQGARVTGQTNFTLREAKKHDRGGFLGFLGFFFLFKLVTLMVAGFILLKIARPYLQEAVDRAHVGFWKETWHGFVGIVMIPIVCLLLAITVIGLAPAGILFTTYILIVMLAKVFAGVLAGAILEKWWDKNTARPVTWKTVLFGTLALMFVGFIPFVGWIAACIVFFAAFGAVAHLLYGKFRSHTVS